MRRSTPSTPTPTPKSNSGPNQVDAIHAIIAGGASGALPQGGAATDAATAGSPAVLQAIAGACHLGKNQAVRTACAMLPSILSDYCVTLPSDLQVAVP